MARILYASQIDEIKGSIGGLSFQRNAAGKVCRLKPSRVQPGSSGQMGARARFGAAASAWLNEEPDVRLSWNQWAAANNKVNYWGEEKTLSGYNWYQSSYNLAVICGGSVPGGHPVSWSPTTVPSFTLYEDSGDIKLSFDSSFAHGSDYLIVYMTPPILSMSLKNRSLLKLIKVISPGTDTTITLTSEWLAVFGFSSLPLSASSIYLLQASVVAVDSTYFFAGSFTSFLGEFHDM